MYATHTKHIVGPQVQDPCCWVFIHQLVAVQMANE
jgi:hypothetical protein